MADAIMRATTLAESSPESEALTQPVTSCPRCQRRTPAARGQCIYCGEPLPIASIESAPPQRNIDTSDLAFNAVLKPRGEPTRLIGNESAIESLAFALGLEALEAHALINAAKHVPLARCQTFNEAEMICALVRSCGVKAEVVADEYMQLPNELLRARRIALTESQLHVAHSNGILVLDRSEIRLTVLGELRNKRVDYIEGLSARRGGSAGVLDSSEYRSEETMLDVYAGTLDRSFRIKADAFDYSGLVSPMAFRSDLNFRAALKTLREELPHAAADEDFTNLSGLLGRAWPERTRNETRGFKRTGLGFRSVAKASAISDNRDQFERYSRLMFLSSDRISA